MSNPDTTRIFNYPEVTTPASDAKILLDSQTVGSKCIDANLFKCDLIDKTITQRGVFEASDDNADGFKKVTVDIPYTDVHVASGSIATFEGEDLPLKSLTASIVPVQAGSGDPSPTNIRPISGWDSVEIFDKGKNLLDTTADGCIRNRTILNDGSIIEANRISVSDYIPIKGGVNVSYSSLTATATGFNKRIVCFDINKNYISTCVEISGNPSTAFNITGQTPSNTAYIRVPFWTETTDTQVELGNQATAYEPYAGTTTTIPFTDGQGQSVEVFGGSVDVINGTSGNEKTLGFVNLGDLTWVKRTDYGEGSYFLSQELSDKLTGSYDMMCSHYKVVRSRNFITATSQIAPANNTNSKDLVVRDDRYSDADTFKNAVNGVQLVYELATPTTFYTQPTSIKSLDGENNIWADTGDVDVEYQTVWVRPSE